MKITISTFFPSCLPYISDHFSPMYLVFNLNSNNMLTVAVIFLPCPYLLLGNIVMLFQEILSPSLLRVKGEPLCARNFNPQREKGNFRVTGGGNLKSLQLGNPCGSRLEIRVLGQESSAPVLATCST